MASSDRRGRRLVARFGLFAATAITAGLLLQRVRRMPAPSRPDSLFVTSPPVPADRALHHIALFTVDDKHQAADVRATIAEELRQRLLALGDLPELRALRVRTGDLPSNADVLLSAEYHRALHLDQVRNEPRHQEMINWYLDHFDERQRKEINFWTDDASTRHT